MQQLYHTSLRQTVFDKVLPKLHFLLARAKKASDFHYPIAYSPQNSSFKSLQRLPTPKEVPLRNFETTSKYTVKLLKPFLKHLVTHVLPNSVLCGPLGELCVP